MVNRLKKKPPTDRDRADAARLQRAGTNGDTVLAHITPGERDLLDVLSDGLLDGGGRNPTSGLLSFGMTDGESGRSGGDANPGGVGGGPAGGQTGGGIGGNTDGGQGGRDGGYGSYGYNGSVNQRRAQELGDYYRDTYINGLVDRPYAPKDTWKRVFQEYWNPSIPDSRYGPVTGQNLGIMGTVMSQLAGGPMSAAMGVGAAMGRAQSPASQAASMAESQATGAKNSTGQDHDGLGSRSAGAASGASAAGGLLEPKPGASSGTATPSLNSDPAGGMTAPGGLMGNDSRERTRTGLPPVVENLLQDYIWRGRIGGGFGW